MEQTLRSRLVLLIVLLGGLLVAMAAQAQDELFVPNFNGNSVTVYDRTASGNAVPLRTISGGLTGLSVPIGVAIDPLRNELFVLNRGANSVTVFSRAASGNLIPLRTLSGPATGLSTPFALALDLLNNELVVVNNGLASVTVYSRTASGNTAPLRTIQGATTGMDNVEGLALDIANNEIFVANRVNTITVYGRTANGNVAPLRTLAGAATLLTGPTGLALDFTHDELIVGNADGPTPNIAAYARGASGNTAPLRTITGGATGLGRAFGLAVDLKHSELIADSFDANAVMVYSRTATGNAAPLRTIQGPATGLSGPWGLTLPPQLSLRATVNQTSFAVGQTLTTTIGALNPGLIGSVDVYIGVLLPDGRIVFFVPGGGTAIGSVASLASFRTIATGVSLGAPLAVTIPSFSTYTWTGVEPRGTYSFFFLAVTAGALTDGVVTDAEILAIEVAPFVFL